MQDGFAKLFQQADTSSARLTTRTEKKKIQNSFANKRQHGDKSSARSTRGTLKRKIKQDSKQYGVGLRGQLTTDRL
jgi:hypothetical protein